MGLSMLSEKCRKCPYVDTCDHKQTESLAYLQAPPLIGTVEPILKMRLRREPVILTPPKRLDDLVEEHDRMTLDPRYADYRNFLLSFRKVQPND